MLMQASLSRGRRPLPTILRLAIKVSKQLVQIL
jgi:hypothetical protein